VRWRLAALALVTAALAPAAAAAPRPIGRIAIPSIELNTVFFNGQAAIDTNNGPSHYPWTGMPGHGRTVAIAGHRMTHTHPFRRLAELRRNALIEINYGGSMVFNRRACYRVTRMRIVHANDVGVTRDLGLDRLVLTTCHPPGTSTSRLVVTARRVAACQ
jgi:sortase A